MKNFFKSFNSFCQHYQIEEMLNNDIFKESITHSSIKNKKNYERLEFFGDSILNFIISQLLFNKFQHFNEGQLAKYKSFLVSREICANVATDITLHNIINISKTENNNQLSIISAVVESIIATIYILYGMNKVIQIVEELFLPYIDNYEEDSKMKLQELSQKHFNILPIYKIISQEGSEHDPIFKISVEVLDFLAIGEGKNKKIAEKNAAKLLLTKLHF